MSVVIGVDASSTRLAAVVLDGPMMQVHFRDKLHGDIDKACHQAYDWLAEIVAESRPKLVAVEAPFIHRLHPSGSVGVIQVNGALLAALKDQRSLSVQPSRWKKTVIGNGNATKTQVSEWVATNHPEVAETFAAMKKGEQDALDAFCIALHGVRVLEVRDRLLIHDR